MSARRIRRWRETHNILLQRFLWCGQWWFSSEVSWKRKATNIPQRIPLCLEPIITCDIVMQMEERVRTLSKQNDASSSRDHLVFFLLSSPFLFLLLIFAGESFSWEAQLANRKIWQSFDFSISSPSSPISNNSIKLVWYKNYRYLSKTSRDHLTLWMWLLLLRHNFAIRVSTGYYWVGHSPLLLYYELLVWAYCKCTISKCMFMFLFMYIYHTLQMVSSYSIITYSVLLWLNAHSVYTQNDSCTTY